MNRRASCFFLLAALLWLGGLPAFAHRPQPLETRVGGWEQFASGQSVAAGAQSPENARGLRVCAYKTASGPLKWLNQDPIGERGGINLYRFVNNNPVNLIDTDGREILDYHQTPSGEWTADSPAPNVGPGIGYIGLAGGAGLMLGELAAEAGLWGVMNGLAMLDMAAHDAMNNNHGSKKDCPPKNNSGGQPLLGMAAPNGGVGPKHGGTTHNQMIDDCINNLPSGAQNIRKNQQQVDIDGNVVGQNRPDVQYDLNGAHYNAEFDTIPSNAIDLESGTFMPLSPVRG